MAPPVATIDTGALSTDPSTMADRQTRNVSLPPSQDEFIDSMVRAGRYRTASEVVRDGVRLLQEAEHRRLLEKWIYGRLTESEEERIPLELRERAAAYFRGLVDEALRDVESGRVSGGADAMKRLRDDLEVRRR